MYIIETERLRLRAFTEDDRDAVASILLDRETTRLMRLSITEEFVDQWLERAISRMENDGCSHLYAERKEDGRFVGVIGAAAALVGETQYAELGYMLHRDFHHQGYAFEGASACIEWLFDCFGADCIVAHIADGNLPSIRLAERLGMQPIKTFTRMNGDVEVLYHQYALPHPDLRIEPEGKGASSCT